MINGTLSLEMRECQTLAFSKFSGGWLALAESGCVPNHRSNRSLEFPQGDGALSSILFSEVCSLGHGPCFIAVKLY